MLLFILKGIMCLYNFLCIFTKAKKISSMQVFFAYENGCALVCGTGEKKFIGHALGVIVSMLQGSESEDGIKLGQDIMDACYAYEKRVKDKTGDNK
jgi:hypothetical protein